MKLMKNSVFLFSIFLVGSIALIGTIPYAQGAWSVADIESAQIEGSITIDGVLDEEWNVSTPVTITLYNYNNQSFHRNLVIKSAFNDSHLFLGISVDETAPVDEDTFVGIVFQVGSDPLFDYDGSSEPEPYDGHDAKSVASDNVTFSDQVTSYGVFALDVSNGGTSDLQGSSYNRTGGWNFEMCMPLDSGDVNGADPSLESGDNVKIMPYYACESLSPWFFWQFRTTDGKWDYAKLWIGEKTIPSYSIPILILCMVGVCFILIGKYKKPK